MNTSKRPDRRTSDLTAIRGLGHAAVLASLLALVLSPTGWAAEIVKLRDGSRVHGEITSFDESTGFTMKRADTGGVLTLRWDHLPATEVTRIKASRGFTGEAPKPYLVDVVHLVLKNGTTESGIAVESSSDDAYSLRRRSGTDSFPKRYVRSIETGRMDGLQVYKPDELYRVISAEHGEPQDALGHLNLAVACEGAGLYESARTHYQAVVQSDPSFKTDLVTSRLQRIGVKIEDEVETRQLDEIRNRLYRRQYGEALEMVDAFREKYPTSRQLGDASDLEVEIRDRKKTAHGRGIISDYFSQLEKRVRTLSRDELLTLEVARESLEDLLHEAIMEEIATDYELTDETVEELWANRSGGSVRTYSYGTGTFILGKKKAVEFGRYDQDDEEDSLLGAGEVPDANADFSDLVEQVKKQRAAKAARRQSEGASAVRATEEGQTPEDWWAGLDPDDRFKWMMAYFAEFGDAMQVIEARGRACRMCSSLGYLEGINEDREPVRITCTTCTGLKYERLVRYR
jgi:hypothetical protein